MKGISPREAKRLATQRRARLRRLLKNGMTRAQIAQLEGISRQRLSQLLKADG